MITQKLIVLADAPYRDFAAGLIPTVDKARIIGVHTPAMRSLAKELLKNESEKAVAFLEELPYYYYKENNLHTFIIAELKDFEQIMKYTKRFLSYIDNWTTCDTFAPKIFLKYPGETLVYVQKWLVSTDTYTICYGIGILLSSCLDAHFSPVHLQWVTAIKSNEYYINMMMAWYLATALVKQYEVTLLYLEAKTLVPFVQNKSIQKARESKRITLEIKEYLLTLKVQKS